MGDRNLPLICDVLHESTWEESNKNIFYVCYKSCKKCHTKHRSGEIGTMTFSIKYLTKIMSQFKKFHKKYPDIVEAQVNVITASHYS